MTTPEHSKQLPVELLTQTLIGFVDPAAQITAVTATPLVRGMSGAAVHRYHVSYAAGGVPGVTSLVTKVATRREWDVLRYLNAQQQPNIPFAHALADGRGDRLLICMQDVGDTTRPTSLEPITNLELQREAAGLASIHAASMTQESALTWLPRVDRRYLEEMLFERAWRPAWERALASHAFRETFRDAIPRVEAAAARIVDDMSSLLRNTQAQTLIHTDLNPSNVLVQGGKPYFIDWQAAMWGPLELDLPHHHCTLAQAEHYRHALAARGVTVSPDVFAERYRVAASYIGLRYMWWTLDTWLNDPSQTAWVQHYIGLVTGEGLDA
jgi:aminoglycoside phosphotransferase (APT) family kinase protein